MKGRVSALPLGPVHATSTTYASPYVALNAPVNRDVVTHCPLLTPIGRTSGSMGSERMSSRSPVKTTRQLPACCRCTTTCPPAEL